MAYYFSVLSAWNLGYTGAGAVIAIIDDGIEVTHPDLAVRFSPFRSHVASLSCRKIG